MRRDRQNYAACILPGRRKDGTCSSEEELSFGGDTVGCGSLGQKHPVLAAVLVAQRVSDKSMLASTLALAQFQEFFGTRVGSAGCLASRSSRFRASLRRSLAFLYLSKVQLSD